MRTAYTVGELIELLKDFDEDNRITIIADEEFDFGITVRESKKLLATIEFSSEKYFNEYDEYNQDQQEG